MPVCVTAMSAGGWRNCARWLLFLLSSSSFSSTSIQALVIPTGQSKTLSRPNTGGRIENETKKKTTASVTAATTTSLSMSLSYKNEENSMDEFITSMELETMQLELKEKDDALERAISGLERAIEEIEQLKKDQSNLQSVLSKAKQKTKDAEKEREKSQKDLKTAQKELSNISNRNSELEDALQKSQDEAKELKKRFEASQRELDTAKKELGTSKKNSQNEIKGLKEDLDTFKKENNDQDTKIKNLERDVDQLQKQITDNKKKEESRMQQIAREQSLAIQRVEEEARKKLLQEAKKDELRKKKIAQEEALATKKKEAEAKRITAFQAAQAKKEEEERRKAEQEAKRIAAQKAAETKREEQRLAKEAALAQKKAEEESKRIAAQKAAEAKKEEQRQIMEQRKEEQRKAEEAKKEQQRLIAEQKRLIEEQKKEEQRQKMEAKKEEQRRKLEAKKAEAELKRQQVLKEKAAQRAEAEAKRAEEEARREEARREERRVLEMKKAEAEAKKKLEIQEALEKRKAAAAAVTATKAKANTKKQPTVQARVSGPVVNNWKVTSSGQLTGIVKGHPSIPDGETIATSPLSNPKAATGQGVVVFTASGSEYTLGTPAPASISQLKKKSSTSIDRRPSIQVLQRRLVEVQEELETESETEEEDPIAAAYEEAVKDLGLTRSHIGEGNSAYLLAGEAKWSTNGRSQVWTAYKADKDGLPVGEALAVKISDKHQMMQQEYQNYKKITTNSIGGLSFGRRGSFVVQREFLAKAGGTFDKDNKNCALVMERGEVDLREYLANAGNIGLKGKKLRDAAMSIAKCIEAVHSSNMVWTDLKSENFIVCGDDGFASGNAPFSVKGIDLESARPYKGNPIDYSPEGCPPEFAKAFNVGDASEFILDYSYDVWSYGMLLYELSTGNGYFDGRASNPTSIMGLLPKLDITESFDDIQDGKMSDLISKCLSNNPKQRPSIQQIMIHPFFMTTPFSFL